MSITNEQLHAALSRLRADVNEMNIPRIKSGICSNVRSILLNMSVPFEQTSEAFQAILHLASEWPERSGSFEFPVAATGYEPSWAYRDEDKRVSFPKWTGEYGETRLRLLDFLIEQTS